MDESGVRPDVVEMAHREAGLSAIYIQPAVQIPLGMTMPAARRADLLRVVQTGDLTVIEDNVYGFFDDAPPLAALAPERCIVLDSLSNKAAPGLTLGFVVPPPHLPEGMMAAVRSGGWNASGFPFAAAQRMLADGTIAELVSLKRRDAQARQKPAAERLSSFGIQANDRCYHLWLILPPHWRSQSFVAAAARRDIALTASTTFAARPAMRRTPSGWRWRRHRWTSSMAPYGRWWRSSSRGRTISTGLSEPVPASLQDNAMSSRSIETISRSVTGRPSGPRT
jgi:DNA-binding transcriptional MocR family regulator